MIFCPERANEISSNEFMIEGKKLRKLGLAAFCLATCKLCSLCLARLPWPALMGDCSLGHGEAHEKPAEATTPHHLLLADGIDGALYRNTWEFFPLPIVKGRGAPGQGLISEGGCGSVLQARSIPAGPGQLWGFALGVLTPAKGIFSALWGGAAKEMLFYGGPRLAAAALPSRRAGPGSRWVAPEASRRPSAIPCWPEAVPGEFPKIPEFCVRERQREAHVGHCTGCVAQ